MLQLEGHLENNSYLLADRITLADIALFPFIRQFAYVDKPWFDQAPYPRLQAWLEKFLQSELFAAAMNKLPPWQEGDSAVYL